MLKLLLFDSKTARSQQINQENSGDLLTKATMLDIQEDEHYYSSNSEIYYKKP